MAVQLGIVEVGPHICNPGIHPIVAVLKVREKPPVGHNSVESGKRNVELDRCAGPEFGWRAWNGSPSEWCG